MYEERKKSLQKEANELLDKKRQAQSLISNIDVRVAQIQGSLQELDRLEKENSNKKAEMPKNTADKSEEKETEKGVTEEKK
jgi:hypothetical protein